MEGKWREIARHPTGSRYICNPPVLNTDEDWIVLVEDLDYAVYQAQRLGWYGSESSSRPAVLEGEEDPGEFCSLRYADGNLNYLFTQDPEYYDRFVAATELAKKYNLLEKPDRIQLFHVVLRGEWIDPPVLPSVTRGGSLDDLRNEVGVYADEEARSERRFDAARPSYPPYIPDGMDSGEALPEPEWSVPSTGF